MKLLRSFVFLFIAISTIGSYTQPINAVQSQTPQVSQATDSALKKAVNQLNKYHQIQINAAIQDPDLSYEMRRALVIADLLFDNNGKLKTQLSQVIPSYFISVKPTSFEIQIINVLNHLNKSWQPFFDRVELPEVTNITANLLLRVQLGLKPQEALTKRHAQVAVLAALLSPLNQGPVGDCFAMAQLIRDHHEYYQRSIQDYSEIIRNGYLTRVVNAQNDHFFFLPVIADDDYQRSFKIDNKGKILGANISLFQAPGFAAALDIMNVYEIQDVQQIVIESLFQDSSEDSIEITPLQVISTYAQVLASHFSALNKEELIASGCYAFSSLTNNPVLRATECAFAALAEDRPDDSTRGNINECISEALKNIWDQADASHENFQKTFLDTFNNSYRLIYNLNIPLAAISEDGMSSDGGFQLYQRNFDEMNGIGKPIITPQDLRELVLNAAALTENQLDHLPQTASIAEQLKTYINDEVFIRDALWAYDEANKQQPDPVTNYQQLSRTPMQSCDGNNPYEVDDIDTGTSFDQDVQIYTPANPQDLIEWCLNLSALATNDLCPMNSPQHAFNFTPDILDIQSFKKSGLNSKSWVRKMIMIPGLKIATREIDSKTKALFSNNVLKTIQSVLPDEKGYQNLVSRLVKNKLTIQQYAQRLLDGVNKLLNSDDAQANQVALYLDAVLLQSLPANDLSTIQFSSIRFAFTNWNEGAKDLYFCAFFNPRTGKIGFGNIDEDKENLQPMDELAWVDHQQWDVDLKPHSS